VAGREPRGAFARRGPSPLRTLLHTIERDPTPGLLARAITSLRSDLGACRAPRMAITIWAVGTTRCPIAGQRVDSSAIPAARSDASTRPLARLSAGAFRSASPASRMCSIARALSGTASPRATRTTAEDRGDWDPQRQPCSACDRPGAQARRGRGPHCGARSSCSGHTLPVDRGQIVTPVAVMRPGAQFKGRLLAPDDRRSVESPGDEPAMNGGSRASWISGTSVVAGGCRSRAI